MKCLFAIYILAGLQVRYTRSSATRRVQHLVLECVCVWGGTGGGLQSLAISAVPLTLAALAIQTVFCDAYVNK
jgi:hypothetical protein